MAKKQMNQEVKKEWVAALRSGKYSQTSGVLYDGDNAYCCLGVLCDIYAKKMKKKAFIYGDFALGTKNTGLGQYGLLPQIVMKWAELNQFATDEYDCSTDIRSGKANNAKTLASLNDDGMSFEKIADIIEERL